jgi:hypothetical protein
VPAFLLRFRMIVGGTIVGHLRTHRLAILVFVALSVIHTWPLATNPAVLSRNDNGDAQLNEWTIAWVVHQLPRDPANLFEGNIFYPAKGSLAFSEPLILPAIMAAPVFWLGGSPVLAYNLLLMVGFTLTALAAYAVIFSWTEDRWAALVAGSLFAFNTHTLTRLAHLQAIHAYGLPLALLFTDRLIREPRVRAGLWLAAAMTSMVYTSGYLVVFAMITVAVAVLARAAEWRRNYRAVLAGFVLAALVTVAVALPIVMAYRRVASEQGMVRSLENAGQFSATPAGYLAATGRLHFSTWSERFSANPVDTFFPGVVASLLAAFGVWGALRTRAHASRVLMLLCIGVAGFVLSLGPRTPFYGWLYAVFPPMQGLRAAARFGNLFLLAMAMLAGIGLALLRQTQPGRRYPLAASIAAVVLVNTEALRAPFEYRRFDGIPRIYHLLAMETAPVVLVETPFYPSHVAFQNAEYVLNSTAHWRPLMNGYSGYTPASYRRVAWWFWYFPREQAIQAMREAGVTHFTVHPQRFGDKAEETIELLSRRPDIELLAISADRGPRLYRFR